MKTIIIFAAGSIAPGVLNQIAAHPQIIDAMLGCLVGILFGLLVATVFIGPTPAPETVTPKVYKAQRKPRRIIEQAKQTQHGLSMFNYQTTEWGIA